MSLIFLAEGDIARDHKVDAIATLINPHGLWYGAVDSAIQRVAGPQYHRQAQLLLDNGGLKDGQVIIAEQIKPHNGCFGDVIFVVDDFKQPLRHLVFKCLVAARDEGYFSIALPLMRTGSAIGQFEKNIAEVVDQIRGGWQDFQSDIFQSRMEILLVIHNNPEAKALLSRYFPCSL